MKNLIEVQVHKLYHWKSSCPNITCFNISTHTEPSDVRRLSNEIVGNKIFGEMHVKGKIGQYMDKNTLTEDKETRYRKA